ncbi:MAG: adenylate kinase [Chlamydiales bacterium]|nr:adenylate kinase [Chlamydiales bacterium]
MLIEPYAGKYSSVLLFGPPGVGKGTLGSFLASAGDQFHLSSGDIFRSLPSQSAAGKLFYNYAKKGDLVPDQFTVEIWQNYVQGLIATNSYDPNGQHLLLDGIPRTLEQAQLLEEVIQVKHIIVLESADIDQLVERLQCRARTVGQMEGVDPNVIQHRLDCYHREIERLLEFYPPHLVSKVDGEQRPLEVLRDVLVRLSHILSKPTGLS